MYQKEERLDEKSLRELQSQRLVEQVKHVYENVPYYRNKMIEKALRPMI